MKRFIATFIWDFCEGLGIPLGNKRPDMFKKTIKPVELKEGDLVETYIYIGESNTYVRGIWEYNQGQNHFGTIYDADQTYINIPLNEVKKLIP